MWRKVYWFGVVAGTAMLVGMAWNDPKRSTVWAYVTAPQHGPVEYLIIWTFVLVLLNAVGNMLGMRDEGDKEAHAAMDSRLYQIERDLDRIHIVLSQNQERTEEAIAKVRQAVATVPYGA